VFQQYNISRLLYCLQTLSFDMFCIYGQLIQGDNVCVSVWSNNRCTD